jgi:chorismate mutase
MSEPRDIQQIREAIQAVDRAILARLKERMNLVDGIAEEKLNRAVPFRDRPREEVVLRGVRQVAAEMGLDPHEIEHL